MSDKLKTVVTVHPVEHSETKDNDSIRSCLACVAGAFILTFVTGCHASFGVILPQLLIEFNVSKTQAAWIGSFAMGMSLMWCPMIGRLCEKFSCRIIASVGGLLCATGLFTTSLAPSIDVMFVTYGLLFGVGSSACIHTAFVEVARRFEKRRALATGIVSIGWSLGTLGVSPLVHFLLRSTGWVQTFRVLGGLLVAASFLTIAYSKNFDKFEKGYEKLEEKKNGCNSFLDFSMFKNLNLSFFILGSSTFPYGYYTPSFFMMDHTSVLGLAANEASVLYCWMGLSNLVARLFSGKLLEYVDPIFVVRTCLFFFGITAMLFTLVRTLPWILVYCVAIGFVDGICSTGSAMSIMKCVGVVKYPQALGFYAFGQAVSSAVAPPLASLVIDLTGQSHNAWYLLGTVTMIGSFVLFAIKFRETPDTKFSEVITTKVVLIQKVSSV